MRIFVATVASVAWLVLVAGTVHRVVATDGAVGWYASLAGLVSVVAVTATVVMAMQHTLPSLFDAWRDGVDYGRRVEARQHGRGEVPAPRVSLHSVR